MDVSKQFATGERCVTLDHNPEIFSNSPQGDAELRLGSPVVELVGDALPEPLADPLRLPDAEAPEVDATDVELTLGVVDEDWAKTSEVGQHSRSRESGRYSMLDYSARRDSRCFLQITLVGQQSKIRCQYL